MEFIERDFVWSIRNNEKDVKIAGSFNDWRDQIPLKRVDECHFHVLLPLPVNPKETKIYYKFIVDGSWLVDEKYPTECDLNGNCNNVFDMAKNTDFLTPEHKMAMSAAKMDSSKEKRLELFQLEAQNTSAINEWAHSIVESVISDVSKSNAESPVVASPIIEAKQGNPSIMPVEDSKPSIATDKKSDPKRQRNAVAKSSFMHKYMGKCRKLCEIL